MNEIVERIVEKLVNYILSLDFIYQKTKPRIGVFKDPLFKEHLYKIVTEELSPLVGENNKFRVLLEEARDFIRGWNWRPIFPMKTSREVERLGSEIVEALEKLTKENEGEEKPQ